MGTPPKLRISNLKKKKESSDLVTDQPGSLVFIAGICIAIVFGLLFRGVFSSEKVKEQITIASLQIHKDLKVDFESANLSLSSHGLPRIAVIIKNITMSSENSCWMKPQVKIDQITLPISLKSLLFGKAGIEEVQIGKMQLKINGELKNCYSEVDAKVATPVGITNQKAVSLVQNEVAAAAQISTDVRTVRIDEFKINHDKLNDIPSIITDVSISLKSDKPKIILLKAQSYFYNENQQRDYSSRAELNIEYSEFPEKKLQTHVFGQFREGHFTIQMQNRLDESQYNVEIDFRHLPLSKIFSTLQRFGLLLDINPRQAWLSLKGRSRGFIDKISTESFEIRDLKLEGDVGELSTELVEFPQLQPLKMKPFLLNAEQVDLGKVISFFSKSSSIPIISDIGRFTGRVEVFAADDFRLYGIHRDLDFVFSGMGSREIQKINQVSLDASLRKQKWNLKLNRFEVDKGKLDGEISLSADKDFQKIDTKFKADSLLLSPSVQSLITRGGHISPLKGNLQFFWDKSVLNKITGAMSADDAEINSIVLEGLNFQFDNNKDFPFLLKTKFQNVMLTESLLRDSFLNKAVNTNWLVDGKIHLNKVSGQLGFRIDHSAEWKSFQAALTGGGERIHTDGAWNSEGNLSGVLAIKSGQSSLKYNVRGTRDDPKLEETDDSINVRVEPTSN